jgi:fatty-acyl-CoA synthase
MTDVSPSQPSLALRLADPEVMIDDSTIGDVLRDAARRAPDAVALVDGVADASARRRWTYAQLLDQVERYAAALATRVQAGSRFALWVPTSPEALILSYASALAGLELVLVNPALRSREVAHVLGQSGAVGLVLVDQWRDHDLRATLREARPELPDLRIVESIDEFDAVAAQIDPSTELPAVASGDVAYIVYTSGTTGAPKGARLTHRAITNAARVGARRFGIRTGDVYVDPLPLYHVGGQFVALEIALHAATMVMLGTFDPGLMLDLFEQERATLTVAVPTMLVTLLEHPDASRRDLTCLRSVSSGGAVVAAELVRRTRQQFDAAVTVVFGQTECCGFISQTFLDDPADVVAETLGAPADGVDVRVVDPVSGTLCAIDEVGELHVRGYNVMAGYHDQPDETARAIDADGWLRTGDLVTLDANGYLRIVGRTKDMIVTGGVNVYAAEIENALLEHPDVAAAAVFGLPDPHWGERVTAALVAAPGRALDVEGVEAFLRGRIAPFKIPKQWEVVPELPTTAWGKVQKFALQEQFEAAKSRRPGAWDPDRTPQRS